MKVHQHHVVFSTALIAQLSLPGAFSADAASANGAYDALAAHRVAGSGRLLDCFDTGPRTGRAWPRGTSVPGRTGTGARTSGSSSAPAS
ncbi:MAG TPA: hypothetical protein VMF60_04625, partial [Acidimicrobiales bacterium]|nr:hypothetical protein [Acidimicrobiales bacterium]